MAATDRLIVTYTGNDERTNIAAAARGAGRRAARRDRPHGPGRRARAGASSATRCSRSTRATSRPASSCRRRAVELRPRDAARARGRWTASARRAARRSWPRRCRRGATPVVELDDLVALRRAPVRAFLRQRLGHQRRRLRRRGRGRAAGRARRPRAVGRRRSGCSTRGSPARTARRAVAGRDRARHAAARRARRAGDRRDLARASRRSSAQRRGCGPREPRLGRRQASTLADGRALSGTVPGVARRRCCGASRYSRVNPRHRLAAWVRLLALTAAHPERDVRGGDDRPRRARRAHARGDGRAARRRSTPAAALEHLARRCVDLYDRGMREPLPLACTTLGRLREPRATAAARAASGSPTGFAERGQRARAPARARRRARASTTLLAARRATTSAGTRTSRALRPLRAAAVGRRCWRARRWRAMTAPFDVCGPLPTGVTVLEASAGTGKTYTIAALAARYVAEGIAAATSCCSSRSRGWPPASCASACASGSSAPSRASRARWPARRPTTTRSSRLLADGSAERGRARAASGSPRALADFDAATIATTHGFCQEVLGGPRRRRRRRARRDVRRGRQRPARRGRRRPLRAPLPPARGDAGVQPRARRWQIARVGGRQPGRADRAAPTRPSDTIAGDARAAGRRASATSSSGASGARGVMTYDDLLTRLRRRRSPGAGGDARSRAAARALPRRARRRVPGHRPGPVGDPARARSATARRRSC